ncbi:MAG TPA: SGNH/GDSL hydrolase family protein [Chthonomonadaceae bacterium]|nr:SGNH/GDSL hydrolase family protein [Chthonomonadaceae bacterium]
MKRFGMSFLAVLFAVLAWGACAPIACAARPVEKTAAGAKQGFYLKDGDRIVFYGDSITDQRLYTTYIETYCRTRFPRQHFTFVHSGWGGDRVSGGGGGPIDVRLRRDVLAYKPTVVTICLGMNDGGYRALDQGLFDQYVKGYEHILDTLKKELPGVRITLLTAPAFDDVTRAPSFPGGYNQVLIAYGDAVKKLGAKYDLVVADTNAPLVAALEKAKASNAALAEKIIPDRVHPMYGGHLVMAAAVLKAWNAPETVAEIQIDANERRVSKHANTRITNFEAAPEGIRFTHTDNALPWPMDRDPQQNPDMLLTLASTDIEHTLNRFTLKVTGLHAGTYTLKVDGTDFGMFTSDDIGIGLNLAAVPNLPANIQAAEVLGLTRKHNDLHFRRWRQVQVPNAKNGEEVAPDIKKQMDDLDAQEAEVVKQLQTAALPKPHTVELIAVR